MNRPDPLGCETRAVETGRRARKLGDLSYAIRCGGTCGENLRSHVVTVEHIADDKPLRLVCDCPSGRIRIGAYVPCVHAATVGRRLEREGKATWRNGEFWHADLGKGFKGRCPICNLWVIAFEDPMTGRIRKADHDPKCKSEYDKRQKQAAQVEGFDPWKR